MGDQQRPPGMRRFEDEDGSTLEGGREMVRRLRFLVFRAICKAFVGRFFGRLKCGSLVWKIFNKKRFGFGFANWADLCELIRFELCCVCSKNKFAEFQAGRRSLRNFDFAPAVDTHKFNTHVALVPLNGLHTGCSRCRLHSGFPHFLRLI